MKRHYYLTIAGIIFIVPFILMSACRNSNHQVASRVEVLSDNWKMQSVDKLLDTDEKSISMNDYNPASWYQAVVPGTVLGSLATTKIVEDPYFGINMQNVDPVQFKQPWWFRTSFDLSGADMKKNISALYRLHGSIR